MYMWGNGFSCHLSQKFFLFFLIYSIHSQAFLCPKSCFDGRSSCDDFLCTTCEFTCGSLCEDPPLKCDRWCDANSCHENKCRDCRFCKKSEFTSRSCKITTYNDVTRYKLPRNDKDWHQNYHSGRPYNHENAPLFVDINGDGMLDFFNSMHAHELNEKQGYNRMELGESVPSNFTADGILLSNSDILDNDPFRYRSVSYRIDIIDKYYMDMDPHGQNFLDLDGDGILDIMVASGGGRGGQLQYGRALALDNFLFWGEESYDRVTGEKVTIFRGGRDEARKAGIHMRFGRVRVNYMLDVNGDGLIDIFCMQDRRASNDNAPGILLINQGNRTWKQDDSMSEFTRAMILTDADGDGLAQEVLLSRGFCYPQRDPKVDPFSDDIIEFCKTRPVGTTAIYKYNNNSHTMEEISKKYSKISHEHNKQPPCCPHGTFAAAHDCHMKSISSADFDGDMIADHVMLYESKMVFYFSSDRSAGDLPNEPSYIGNEISLPCIGESVRVIDLDNDGVEEILVMCIQRAQFLLYSRVQDTREWTLENDCNNGNALGALVNISLATFTEEELFDACNEVNNWKKLEDFCQIWKESGKLKFVETAGLSTVDINNDGFIDAVVTYDLGYVRFLLNSPNNFNKNEFISFELVGSGTTNNKYGIGATLRLFGNKSNGERFNQFREISSYQHTTDKYGYKEDRTIFGLGVGSKLIKLDVVWPSGKIQTLFLTNWSFKGEVKPIKVIEEMIIKPTNQNSKFIWYIDTIDGNLVPIVKDCEWLSRRPGFHKTKLCKRNDSFQEYLPPKNVCPSICKEVQNPSTSCNEKKSNTFVWYTETDKNNITRIIDKDCSWLSRRQDDHRSRICKNSSPFKQFKAAKVACPFTCRVCNITQPPLVPINTCEQSELDMFAWYVEINENNEEVLETRSCGWLSRRINKAMIKRICKNSRSIHGTRAANLACPIACDQCKD